jgi:L-lactate dehydrogenase (cytochrome)
VRDIGAEDVPALHRRRRASLALGARAVLVGRAQLYGLAAGGEAGVVRAIEILREELIRDLTLLGATRVASLDRSFVRRREGAARTG